MTMDVLHRILQGLRARFRSAGPRIREELRYSAWRGWHVHRRWVLGSAATIALAVIGLGGYAIGASQRTDADQAYQAGAAEGGQRGAVLGTFEGYARAHRPARERAYDAAYRTAYRNAYRAEFEDADLAVPGRVLVSGP